MSDFSNPESSASVSFRPNGIYYGIVTNVDEEISRVWVLVPRISVEVEYGPLAVSSLVLPREGERVACVFVENRADSLVVLGVVRNATSFTFAPPVVCTSTTRPDFGDVPAGTTIFETDTFLTYVWTGTGWGGISSGGSFSAAGTYVNDFGVGIGAVSPRMPFYASRSHLPISLAGATSGQAVFGLTSGPNVALGSVTGSVALTDVDTIQARVGTAAGVLKINPLGGAVQFGITVAVSAGSFSGNLNATQLTSGTVPAGRLAGAYTGITQLGSTLNAGGGLTITGNVQVNGDLNATAMNASQLTFGTLPPGRLAGQSYTVVNLLALALGAGTITATQNMYSPRLINNTGSVEIRPNNNGDRNFVLTSGTGGPTQGGGGHYLRGRLSLLSSLGEKSGLWFANINNANYPHFIGRNDGDDALRIYASEAGIDAFMVLDDGRNVLNPVSQALTTIGGFDGFNIVSKTISLRECKNNILPIGDPWEILDAVQPRSFTWKPPTGASQLVSDLYAISPQYGFVVEELMEDAPSLVTYNANEESADDITGWDPAYYHGDHITALTVAAVQDLKAQITALEERIESLEA
jgi:hypothetical protein